MVTDSQHEAVKQVRLVSVTLQLTPVSALTEYASVKKIMKPCWFEMERAGEQYLICLQRQASHFYFEAICPTTCSRSC